MENTKETARGLVVRTDQGYVTLDTTPDGHMVSAMLTRNLDKIGGQETILLNNWAIRTLSDVLGVDLIAAIRAKTGISDKIAVKGPRIDGGFNGW